MEFLGDLNDRQREAVAHTDGPVLVLAGAGSGKTRVLTYKIAYIVSRGLAAPFQILAVTFTNKAAGEMKERIASLFRETNFPYIGTFHHFCSGLLRVHGVDDEGGKNFVIYDERDRKAVIKECIKELDISEDGISADKVIYEISHSKNRMIGPEAYSHMVFDGDSRIISGLYSLYMKKMRSYNALDFDDLIMKAVRILEEQKEILDRYAGQFKYVLVDEYQDINTPQYELIRLLSSVHRNITVVGDDDQSIYGFRGAEAGIFSRFESDFPDSVLVKLERNYRSTRRILEAANYLMKHNRNRKEKNLWSKREDGALIGFYSASEGRNEARFVVLKIKELMRTHHYTYRDFAVFYRTNAQSRLFEEACIQEGIPYNLIGSLRFYERKEIKDLIAYMRVILNPDDSISLKRIINVPPRSIGKVTLGRIEAISREKGVNLSGALRIYAREGEGGPKIKENLRSLIQVLEEAGAMIQQSSASGILEKLITQTGYLKYVCADGTAESVAREENINELFNVIKEFEKIAEERSLQAFLSHISLISDSDLWDEEEGRINLMTFHLTKGLEFPVAFITGFEERFLPHVMSLQDHDDIEEERRLCYVGITRAKDMLFISHAKTRMMRGEPEVRIRSRFLKEIPSHLLHTIGGQREVSFGGEELSKPSSDSLSMNDRVSSEVFGAGTVKRVDGDVVTVEFEDGRIRKVVRSFLQKERESAASCAFPYERGDRVVHTLWGSGIVCSLYPHEREVLVSFPGEGTKRIAISHLSAASSNTAERVNE